MGNKPRIIKNYDQLETRVIEQIKLSYPYGFEEHLVKFQNSSGAQVFALPFETEDIYYLIRMSVQKAKDIIAQDEDFDDEGNLKDEIREEYEEKHDDKDDLIDNDD